MKWTAIITVLVIVLAGCKSPGGTSERETKTGTTQALPGSSGGECVIMEEFPIPTAAKPTNEHNQALTGGELKLVDGCLKAANHILIWPYGYKALKCNDTVFVYNAEDKMVFRTGDILHIGGGESGDISSLNNGQVNIPSRICTGITWIVGEISSEHSEVYSNLRFRDVKVRKTGDHQFRITGKAQLFEATLSWVVVDGHEELAKGFETTDAGAPEWGNFSFIIDVPEKKERSKLHLILFESSARDGSRQHELPIMLY